MSKRLNRRQRLIRWLQFRVDERWCDLCEKHRWPDWTLTVIERPTKSLCHLLRAHVVVNDQCGIPSHRYCAWCMASMANRDLDEGGQP